MSSYRDRTTTPIWTGLVVEVADVLVRAVWFGGYAPDSSERQILKGNVFSALLSNTFGNAR